jgi:hypothetical protein
MVAPSSQSVQFIVGAVENFHLKSFIPQKLADSSTGDEGGYCVLQRHMSSFHLFFQTVQ